VLCRKVASDGLVTLETHRYSVPPAYGGRTIAVHWRAEGTIQLDPQGTLSATHRRADGQHQLCVAPVHDQALRPQPPRPAVAGGDGPLALTTWTGPLPEVAIRPLACYEALVSQEGGYD
jgi:hypothetical protein